MLVIVIMLMAFVPQLFAATSPNESGACQLENARVGPTADKPFGYTVAGCDMWASLVWGTGKSVIVAILVDHRHRAHRGHHRHRGRLVRRASPTPSSAGSPTCSSACRSSWARMVFLAIFPTRNIYDDLGWC